jgi:threonine dehydrogenase-like Zn-dependent dehydrogenase
VLVRAATAVGPLRTEIREYPFPEIPPDAGLLQVEAVGVCGSDWRAYNIDGPLRIMGHESVGRIFHIGPVAAARWGLKENDRVLVEEYLPCGRCNYCHSGEYRFCEQAGLAGPAALHYGTIPIAEAPGLWGGYSQFQYLHPNSILHRLPEGIPAELAALSFPLGNGFQWILLEGSIGPGKSILIQGAGRQGLACAVAAKAAGAACVIVSGLTQDEKRLQVAKAIGADHAIDVEKENLEERVQSLTGGQGVDLSIDTVGSETSIVQAIRAARKGGTVFFAASPEAAPPDFRLSDLLTRGISLRPCHGHSYQAVELALQYIASGRSPLYLMATHRFKLSQVDLAIRSVGGQGASGAIHVTVFPWT